MSKKQYHAIGLMSGTSLDGLDVAWCRFEETNKQWAFKILKSKTIPYGSLWKNKLSSAPLLASVDLLALHVEYGHWLGKVCKQFIQKNKITKLNCIASHGHTVFHQPKKNLTFQLGDGNAVYAETGIPTVYNFRSLDVQLGGQGAPLVPIGDQLLFSRFNTCLNLGGIANLSFDKSGKRVAFDICFANMGLNYLANKIGLSFDKHGRIAASGHVNKELLQKILAFHKPFRTKRPSLAREHFETELQKLLDNEAIPVADRLCTVCESIAIKISESFTSMRTQSLLITGGGARNSFLISRIKDHLHAKTTIQIPGNEIIDFKEALVFAFLGILRLENKINVLKSVTGARQNSCSGAIVG